MLKDDSGLGPHLSDERGKVAHLFYMIIHLLPSSLLKPKEVVKVVLVFNHPDREFRHLLGEFCCVRRDSCNGGGERQDIFLDVTQHLCDEGVHTFDVLVPCELLEHSRTGTYVTYPYLG